MTLKAKLRKREAKLAKQGLQDRHDIAEQFKDSFWNRDWSDEERAKIIEKALNTSDLGEKLLKMGREQTV